MKRPLVLVKSFVLALLLGAVAIPASAFAHHPPSYENPAEKLLEKDWTDHTGLARGTLRLVSDFIEAARHGFGLAEGRHAHTASCLHGDTGHNGERLDPTHGGTDACGCTPGACHCPCGCPPSGCSCGAPSSGVGRAEAAGFRRD